MPRRIFLILLCDNNIYQCHYQAIYWRWGWERKCVGYTFNKCYANYILKESGIVVAFSNQHCLQLVEG